MTRHKILIIDDEPDLLTAYARSVRAAGYDVVMATHGEAALTEVESGRPDLVLSDVMMPGLNGFQTTRKLKETPGCENIPVILMSAKTDPADHFWAEEVGAVILLKKPLDTRLLIERFGEILKALPRSEGTDDGAD